MLTGESRDCCGDAPCSDHGPPGAQSVELNPAAVGLVDGSIDATRSIAMVCPSSSSGNQHCPPRRRSRLREGASARPTRPKESRPALVARTGRSPCRSMLSPTRGETRPAVSSPSDTPLTTQASGQSVLPAIIRRAPGEDPRHPEHRNDDADSRPPTRFQRLRRPAASRHDRAAATRLSFMLRESVGHAARIDVARSRAAAAASGLTLLRRKG
jgi:hypothetical protein